MDGAPEKSAQKIESKEACSAEHILDRPAKKIESEAIEEQMKRHGRFMKKLESKKLPDTPLLDSIETQTEKVNDGESLEKQGKAELDDIDHDERNDEHDRHGAALKWRALHVRTVVEHLATQ